MKERGAVSREHTFVVAVVTIALVLAYPLPKTIAASQSNTSSPPQACVRYSGNPVLPQQTFPGSNGTTRAFVMYNGTAYNAWYTASYSGVAAIGFASSSDGISWHPYPSPVLQHGGNSSWDSGGVSGPMVLWNGSYYLMYFTGFPANITMSSQRSIGVVLSKDMIHWREYPQNPLIKPGPDQYDSFYIRSGSVVYDGGVYKMWYTGAKQPGSQGFSTAIDYATSTEGLHWTKYSGNPVVTSEVTAAVNPAVVKVGQTYFMAYTTGSFVISDATSLDGANWKTTGAVLLAGTNISSDWEGEVDSPSIVVSGSNILLWYTGYGFWTPPQPPAPSPAVGLAYCSLILIPTTETTTSVARSTIVTTSTYITTVVSTVTETLALPEPKTFEYLSGVLALALVVAVGFVLRKRR